MPGSLPSRPADESVSDGHFPSGGAKDHDRQLPPSNIFGQVLYVLADRAVEAPIMIC